MRIIIAFVLFYIVKTTIGQFDLYKSPYPFILPTTETFCDRDWMGSEKEMDSLKKIILHLERQLMVLEIDSVILDTVPYQLLYKTEYVVRQDPSGYISHQFCTDDNEYGTTIHFSSEDLLDSKLKEKKVVSYNKTYLTITEAHFYLGNSMIWTTVKKYYKRI